LITRDCRNVPDRNGNTGIRRNRKKFLQCHSSISCSS